MFHRTGSELRADIVIVPLWSLPTTSIEDIVVFAGIPVPSIVAPTTSCVVVISVIVVEPVVTLPVRSNCHAA